MDREEKASNERFNQAKKQVDEVADVMRTNMTNIMAREAKLGDLELRADKLHTDTEQFKKTGGKLKKKYYWENMKMKILILICSLLLLLIIIIIIAFNVS